MTITFVMAMILSAGCTTKREFMPYTPEPVTNVTSVITPTSRVSMAQPLAVVGPICGTNIFGKFVCSTNPAPKPLSTTHTISWTFDHTFDKYVIFNVYGDPSLARCRAHFLTNVPGTARSVTLASMGDVGFYYVTNAWKR